MKKRILSLILTLAMVTSMFCTFTPISASAAIYSPVAVIDWNGHTYHLYDESMTWEEAKQYCENSGGYLATFTSEEEWNVIHEQIIENGNQYWFGGYGKGSIDTWIWITGEAWSYSDWCPGEPNNAYNGAENYLGTWTGSYQWNDYRPDVELGFICEFGDVVTQQRYTFNGHTYQIFDSSISWEDAKSFCETLGGHLVSINSKDENEFIESIIKDAKQDIYWTGGLKEESSDVWQWLDGTLLTYTNWAQGEPNNDNGREAYMEIAKTPFDVIEFGQWNDNEKEGDRSYRSYGFICEFEEISIPSNRIELSSNRSSMSVIEGETFNVLATIYDNNNNPVSPTGITFSVENKSVAEVIDGNFSGNNAIAVIKANTAGTTTLKVSDANKNVVVTAPITVSRSHNNTYTIYSVPHGTTNYSWALVNDTYNFYNFAGLYVDNFIKTVRADGSCSIAFDAYNENYTYGIVEVYDSNGELKDAVVIDKYKPDNTSIKEVLWDNGGSVVQLVNPFDNQTWQSYKNSAFSEETRVTLDSVPAGGYIRITPSSRESLLLCILNEIDIVLSTQDAIEKIAGFGGSTNVELFQNIANSMVKQDTIYKPIKEHMKDYAVDSSKKLLKGIGKDFVINANSIGTFVETIKNNLSTIDWQNMVEDACVDTAFSITEKVFKGVAGMAGVGLNACFAIGSTSNLICECNDFVNLIDATSIYIQNPEDSRTFKGVSVETVIPINNNVSLETYRIESTEIESHFEKNTFSNRNFTEEFLIKQGLYKKPIVEYINISMINNGKETQLNCKATVSVPVPESMKALQWDDTPWDNAPLEEKSLKVNVYRVETDGTLTKMNNANIILRKDDYYVQFETDHFSVYAIVAEADIGNPTTSFGSQVSDWAKEEVEEAYDKNLVPEVLVGKDLTQKVDRAEFAAIAVALYENLTGGKATKSNNPFNDISGNACEDDILKAYNLDITIGTSATTFAPNANITREQMATMLTRAYKKSEFKDWTIEKDSDFPLNFMGIQKFADDNEISDYAKESVYFMARWEIIKGIGNNKFAPKNSSTLGESYGYATREQAIIVALRSAKHL